MLDRESTFKDPDVVALLKSDFVPVAFDQWYVRQQQDVEGKFYREIISQGPRKDPDRTTQGFYIVDPAGGLYFYNNNRGPERILRLMKFSVQQFAKDSTETFAPLQADAAENVDPEFARNPPEGSQIVRVHSKVLGGYRPTEDAWRKIFQQAIGRDNLWVTAEEISELAADRFPESLARRISRFHLVDNTRGEPPMWEDDQVYRMQFANDKGQLRGRVYLKTADDRRGFAVELLGRVQFEKPAAAAGQQQMVKFELLAQGLFWGHGRYTPNPPPGEFPLAIAFTLADGSDLADSIAPQGTKGWYGQYVNPLRR